MAATSDIVTVNKETTLFIYNNIYFWARVILGFFIEGFLVKVFVAVTEAAIGSFLLGGSGGMLPQEIF